MPLLIVNATVQYLDIGTVSYCIPVNTVIIATNLREKTMENCFRIAKLIIILYIFIVMAFNYYQQTNEHLPLLELLYLK